MPLAAAHVFVLYFPSRFDLPVDTVVGDALTTFGARAGSRTRVAIWDTTDQNFPQALRLFGLQNPPALVLATGMRDMPDAEGAADSLYCISFTGHGLPSEPGGVAEAVNIAHEVLTRCDRREIAGYVRRRRIKALLKAIGLSAGTVRDELVKLQPTLGLLRRFLHQAWLTSMVTGDRVGERLAAGQARFDAGDTVGALTEIEEALGRSRNRRRALRSSAAAARKASWLRHAGQSMSRPQRCCPTPNAHSSGPPSRSLTPCCCWNRARSPQRAATWTAPKGCWVRPGARQPPRRRQSCWYRTPSPTSPTLR